MNKKSLIQLYAEHTGKTSHKWSSYLHEYEHLFSRMREESVSILEIGIQNGGSLDIWSKYFKNASVIVGVDIDAKCKELNYDDSRIHVVIGDVSNQKTILNVLSRSSKFDIIIDDGSHLSEDIVKTFLNLFPHLNDTGVFIVEDLHCSYWEKFQGGLFYPYSSIGFFKKLVDIINFEHWGVNRSNKDLLTGFLEKYDFSIDSESLERIQSVEFLNSMCIIRKSVERKGLGKHVVVGNYEDVVQGNLLLNSLPYSLSLFTHSDNYWSMLEAPPEELYYPAQEKLLKLQDELNHTQERLFKLQDELNQMQDKFFNTEHKLADTEHKLADTEHKLADTEHKLVDTEHEAVFWKNEINNLKNSKSWKLTAPLRFLLNMSKSLLKSSSAN